MWSCLSKHNPVILGTFTALLLLGIQIVTVSAQQTQTNDLILENVSSEFSKLSGAEHIFQDSYGFLWFGCGTGLKKFDGYQVMHYQRDPTGQDSSSLSDNSITAIAEDNQRNLWVGTMNGLNELNAATGKFRRFKADSSDYGSISNNYVTSLCCDRSGTLWIGTQQGGLNAMVKLSRNDQDSLYFLHYQNDPVDSSSLSNNYIRFIVEDSRSDTETLWIGTANGLNRFDRRTRKFTRYFHNPENPNSLKNNDLFSIYQDNQGDLWIGASEGWLSQLSINKNGEIQFSHYRLGINVKVLAITGDNLNNLWISAYHHGLYQFNKKIQQIAHYDQANLNLKFVE